MTRRRYREPSERNRKIWRAVRIERRGQEEIAREHGISQPRVSRIVRRMGAWYAEHSPEVLELADLAARGRLAEVEFRAQTEQNLTEAISALRRSQEPLVTKKERKTTTKEQGEVVREVIVEETTTRQQPVSTRAITLAGKFARELWELAGGLGARGSGLGERRRGEERESGRAGDATADHSPTHHSPNEEDVDDRLKDYERRQREGRESAVRWLESVCRGSVTLEEAEHLNYCGAINTGWIYPSYYEKNADGMTFKVAAWVRDHVPPERLHGPERQPVWTCHDIPDWDAWHNSSEEIWRPVSEACWARWEAWRVSVGAPPRHGNPNIFNSEFWTWHETATRQGEARAEPQWEGEPQREGEAPAEPRFGAGLLTSPNGPSEGLASAAGSGDLRSGPGRGQETRAQQVEPRDDVRGCERASVTECPPAPTQSPSPAPAHAPAHKPPPAPAPRKPTIIERRLASGRRMSKRERRRLEFLARVRRERLERTG